MTLTATRPPRTAPDSDDQNQDQPGASATVLQLRHELRAGTARRVAELDLGARSIEVLAGSDALWAIVRRPGRGGLALRIAHTPGGCGEARVRAASDGEALRIEVETVIGVQRIAFRLPPGELPLMRVTTSIEPDRPLLVSHFPRDLYPLGRNDDPLAARGEVEAAQRGLNAGLCYFRIEEPAFGSTLYFQNLTALNGYFQATKTKPDGAVGGKWPELGYLPPMPQQSPVPPSDPLPAGQPTVISDVLLAFHDDSNADEQEMARRYMSMLAAILRAMELPPTDFRDWPGRAERTLRDLERSPKATIRHYGFRYVHPYTAAEYPDSMVQLAVVTGLRDYERWKRAPVPLAAELERGMRKFFDRRIGTLRRYLPNVGKDKDRDAVDSWYLYHPLLNLGRLALQGDKRARRLFEQSIAFGIKAAHHFQYKWPIQYHVTDFSVIQEARDGDGLGQTDVGGLYAYVMLQAFELTDDKRYLDEARRAIDAARDMRFELNYQANLTAWGAAACMRLWRITNERIYLRQSDVYLASFFHNAAIWESEIELARHYRNFMGVTALHDAPYMAIYECFDSFLAFEQYLREGGTDIDPGARLLVSEYCRYALDRAWFYYPDALPEEAIAPKQRENNGHVDRALSFPVEDLYVDGQQAGQVGQEIYGCGAAFAFATRAFHPVEGAPFLLFCDHFLLAREQPTERSLSFQLGGCENRLARVALIRAGRATLSDCRVATLAGPVEPLAQEDGRTLFEVPADGRITVSW